MQVSRLCASSMQRSDITARVLFPKPTGQTKILTFLILPESASLVTMHSFSHLHLLTLTEIFLPCTQEGLAFVASDSQSELAGSWSAFLCCWSHPAVSRQPCWTVAVVSSFWVLCVLICHCPTRFLYKRNSVKISSSLCCINVRAHQTVFAISLVLWSLQYYLWVSSYSALFEMVKGKHAQISPFHHQCTNLSTGIGILAI